VTFNVTQGAASLRGAPQRVHTKLVLGSLPPYIVPMQLGLLCFGLVTIILLAVAVDVVLVKRSRRRSDERAG